MTDRVTCSVVTLEASDVTVVGVVVKDSSTFLSGVRPRLGDRRLGVTAVRCVTCFSGGSSFGSFGDGGAPRFRAGDRDRERRLPGDLDLLRVGLRDGEVELEPSRLSLYNTKPRNVR